MPVLSGACAPVYLYPPPYWTQSKLNQWDLPLDKRGIHPCGTTLPDQQRSYNSLLTQGGPNLSTQKTGQVRCNDSCLMALGLCLKEQQQGPSGLFVLTQKPTGERPVDPWYYVQHTLTVWVLRVYACTDRQTETHMHCMLACTQPIYHKLYRLTLTHPTHAFSLSLSLTHTHTHTHVCTHAHIHMYAYKHTPILTS